MSRKRGITHEMRLHGPPKGGGIERWTGAVVVPYQVTDTLLMRFQEQAEIGEISSLHFERRGRFGLGGGVFWIGRQAKEDRPLCEARTRSGTPCRAKAVEGRERCRLHGGLSTGAKTAEGRARICESNRRRAALKREQEAQAQNEYFMP